MSDLFLIIWLMFCSVLIAANIHFYIIDGTFYSLAIAVMSLVAVILVIARRV